jgi:hypothetical protein
MKRIARIPAKFAVLSASMALAVMVSFAGIGTAPAQDIAATERPAAVPKSATKRSQQPQVSNASHVYLLRGLLNIFSLGMDDLAQKINARGVRATVHNHAEWQTLSDEIAARYKAGNKGAIVLIGHSLGADAVMFMGEYLGKKGVPIALIVPFDGTGSFPATSNVARVMNLKQRDYARMTRGSGFRGELANIDVTHMGVGHIDIDKSDRLHQMVVGKILAVVGRGGGTRTAAPDGAPAPRPAPRPVNDNAPPASDAPKPAPSSSTSATSGVAAEAPAVAPAAVAAPAAAPAPATVSSVAREAAPKPAESAPLKPAIRF